MARPASPPEETLTLRPARIQEAALMAAMSRELVEVGLPWRWRPRTLAAELRRDDTLAVVARPVGGGPLLGFAVMRYGATSAHLVLLAVAPHARRQGLGRRLLEWLEECARVAGTFDVALEVREDNPGARAFYRCLGYRPVALVPGYYHGREAAIRMARSLALAQPPAELP